MPKTSRVLTKPSRRRLSKDVPAPLSAIKLTPEEEKLFDEDFVSRSIAGAMAAVQAIDTRREARINNVLAMRDVLFAEWLRDHVEASDPDKESTGDSRGEAIRSARAAAYQRVTRFAAQHNLAVGEYLKFVEVFEQLSQPISESTSDEEITRLFDLVGVRTE